MPRTSLRLVRAAAAWLACAALGSGASGVIAQTVIQTDSSWGRTPETLTPGGMKTFDGNHGVTHAISGNVYTIAQDQGRVAGANLFHSFQSFSVGAGDAAVFRTTTPTLTNVISRVSGSSATQINGLLALVPENGGAPNFFFINPAGVTFGAGALVDVPAAFHVSAASYLRMGETLFKAGSGSDSTLTVAAPEAFGFLGREGAVRFRNMGPIGARPAVTAGRLDVTAPQIELFYSNLSVRDGAIRMLATGTAPVSVALDGVPPISGPDALSMQSSSLEVFGPRLYGFLWGSLRAGGLTLSGGGQGETTAPLGLYGAVVHADPAFMLLQSFYDAPGPWPDLAIAGGEVDLSNAELVANPGTIGPGPGIDISARSLMLTRSVLSTRTSGNEADGGSISIRVQGEMHAGDTSIGTTTGGPASAGSIAISAGNLALDASDISSETSEGAQGDSGSIRLDVAGRFDLRGASTVRTATRSLTGRAGRIDISAARMELGRLGVAQTAARNSSGRTGGIALRATDEVVMDYPGVRIVNAAVVADPSQLVRAVLAIDAPVLTLSEYARVAALASGNVAPAEILLNGVPQASQPAPGAVPTLILLDRGPGEAALRLDPTASASYVHTAAGSAYYVPGDIYTIEAESGTLFGPNLIHDFAGFDLGSGDAAVFRIGTLSVRNVIARIAATAPTTIDGLLALDAPIGTQQPRVFLINTAGLALGPGARVDVPGSLHLSTASRLRLEDGTFLDMRPVAVMSSQAPVALDFTGEEGAISFDRVAATREYPWIGSVVSVSATAVELLDSSLTAAPVPGLLANGGAAIRLAGVGTVPYSLPLDAPPETAPSGTVSLWNSVVEANGSRFRSWINARDAYFPFDEIYPRVLQAGWIAVAADEVSGSGKLIDIRGPAIRSLAVGMFVDSFDGMGPPVPVAASSLSIAGAEVEIIDNLLATNSYQSAGPGVDIVVAARNLAVDGSGLIAITNTQAPGGATSVHATERLSGAGSRFRNWISAQTRGAGRAGDVTVQARDIQLANMTIASGVDWGASGPGGAVYVTAARDIDLSNRATISAYSHSTGLPGHLQLRARAIRLRSASSIFSGDTTEYASLGRATDRGTVLGGIRIEAGELAVTEHSQVQTRVWSRGASGGAIEIALSGDLEVSDGSAIDTTAGGALPSGENEFVEYGTAAGAIDIRARRVLAQRLGRIVADARPGSSGVSGGITIAASEKVTLTDWGHVSLANTVVSAAPESIDNRITIITPAIELRDVGFVLSETFGNVRAADIYVRPSAAGTGDLAITTNIPSELTSSTTANGAFGWEAYFAGREHLIASGQGGDLDIRATNLTLSRVILNSDSKPGATGGAGSVTLTVSQNAVLANGARVSTNAFDRGNAGEVRVTAHNLVVDASEIAGTVDDRAVTIVVEGFGFEHFYPARAATGNGGSVHLDLSGSLKIVNGGLVSASTLSRSGRAGTVTVVANDILVDGPGSAVRAAAASGSSGWTGDLAVTARERLILSNGASLSIRNDAAVAAPQSVSSAVLRVAAPRITLEDAQITAESSENVAASDIRIDFTDRLVIDPSGITTSANLGDGGDITIDGAGLIWLDHSYITTSTGSGNGGDISIRAGTLLMETGFIQANTGGAGTSGGNVRIAVRALVPSGSSLSLADPGLLAFQPNAFGFNVIQAAAPSGVSGTIGLSAPVVDVAGELGALEAEVIATGPLGKDLCRVSAGSSLTPMGRGGLRPSAAGPIRPDRPAAQTRAAAAAQSPASVRLAQALDLDCRY